MVKIETMSAEKLHEKLKVKRVGKLAEEVFGEDFKIYYSPSGLCISDKSLIAFLIILTDANRFSLSKKEYFDRTYKFAERYESNFGGEVTIKTTYSKR